MFCCCFIFLTVIVVKVGRDLINEPFKSCETVYTNVKKITLFHVHRQFFISNAISNIFRKSFGQNLRGRAVDTSKFSNVYQNNFTATNELIGSESEMDGMR